MKLDKVVTFIRAKKDTTELHIRHKLTQSIQSRYPETASSKCKNTNWIAWRKPQKDSLRLILIDPNLIEQKEDMFYVTGQPTLFKWQHSTGEQHQSWWLKQQQ